MSGIICHLHIYNEINKYSIAKRASKFLTETENSNAINCDDIEALKSSAY